ncbi:MAG: MBOAT family protein, partial [Oscillospiraceae bacterium]|nr:MBOAT family protein [Oscillospiraceae bacterium]
MSIPKQTGDDAKVAMHAAIFLFFFFPAVYLLHTLLPGRRAQNILLTAASLLFYAFGQWQGIPVLLLSASASYAAGGHMNGPRKKIVLTAAVIFQLLLLCSFKYLTFLTDILNAVPAVELPRANLPLPVGISFFTFKAISYVVDAYRDPPAEKRRFGGVLLYIAFFPQITSGPITRYGQFAPQLETRRPSAEQTARGLRRFITGFAKKLLIAGLISPIADSAFSLDGGLDIRLAWLGAAAYMVQLYADFSGYSDMAIGMAAMFGFETPENFNYPYLADSVTDFWRRWHISLSVWFRDYLYIPLGGNRRGKFRTALNKAAVFLLCGLWHGAGWTYLLWGAWHGLFSAAEILSTRFGKNAKRNIFYHIYALLVICIGFVIFRARNLTEMLAVLKAMFTGFALRPASTLALERITPAAWCALFAGVLTCLPVAPKLRALPRKT